ncbi:hypothetical protein NYE53_02795 [Bacillus sp. FSL R5-0523]|uniref:hypothetical protein n=1 Tax=Bacillus sp. FSL R5-0523 TaxID=2975304 RepID=UPI0030DAB4BB
MIFSDATGDQFPKTTVNGSDGANRTTILGYHSEGAEVVDTIDVYEQLNPNKQKITSNLN